MPYRRLPNTDLSRKKAMRQAIDAQSGTYGIILSPSLLHTLKVASSKFEAKLNYQQTLKKTGIQKHKSHLKLAKKSRLYLSHFLQVMNFSIIRGELSSEIRLCYGLGLKDKKIPDMGSDSTLLKWGERIIEGEKKRVRKGGNPIYNPSLALVTINFDKFKESWTNLNFSQKTREKTNSELDALRTEVDALIAQVWDSIEQYYSNLSKEKSREQCQRFGISYVYRRGELEKLERQRYLDNISPSLNFDYSG